MVVSLNRLSGEVYRLTSAEHTRCVRPNREPNQNQNHGRRAGEDGSQQMDTPMWERLQSDPKGPVAIARWVMSARRPALITTRPTRDASGVIARSCGRWDLVSLIRHLGRKGHAVIGPWGVSSAFALAEPG